MLLAFAAQPVFLIGFVCFIGLSLALDLGVFSGSTQKAPTAREATIRTLIWVSIGLSFSIIIYLFHADLHHLVTRDDFEAFRARYSGHFLTSSSIEETRAAFSKEALVQYISGYFVEYSLSLDNLFVMMLVFRSFRVQHEYEKKILLWGVLGAIVMRFIFIFVGGAMIVRFHWVLYLFGAFLIYSGLKLLLGGGDDDDTLDTENHGVVKFARRIFRISTQPSEGRFFTRLNGKFAVTSLFVVLLVIEVSDVVFAVDSVPAIFGITRDPYLVFFSNIFAILGLRSLYFLLGQSMKQFKALQYGLSLVLIYIGAKMIFEKWFDAIGFTHIHNLFVLFAILGVSVLFSFILPDSQEKK